MASTASVADNSPRDPVRRNRLATERALMTAFEEVMLRDGVQGLGVNAVAKQAGVNKALIYRYFGDLPGLAREWTKVSDFWPTVDELTGPDKAAFESLNIRERVRHVLSNYVDCLRRRPHTIEMLAAEMLQPSPVTQALAEGMADLAGRVDRYFQLSDGDTRLFTKVWEMTIVVHAVTGFAAIRQRSNPNLLGLDLAQEKSWDYLRDVLNQMAAAYLAE